MSQAYKCDLCGEFYTEEDFGAECNTTWKVNFITIHTCGNHELTYDLCPKCGDKIEEMFLKEK